MAKSRTVTTAAALTVALVCTLVGRRVSSVFDAYIYLLLLGAKGLGVQLTLPFGEWCCFFLIVARNH